MASMSGKVDPDAPDVCPNGHRLEYPNVHVGWIGCACPGATNGGHRYWQCLTCRAELYRGEHDPDGTVR